jgi:flagella basal body P-ring formation protein FlgA
MSLRFVIALALLASAARADSGRSVIEQLIAAEWQPFQVAVEWSSTGALPISVAAHDDWTLVATLPPRPCGSLIVQLERSDADGQSQRVSISGNCRVRVETFTVNHQIPAGQPLTVADLVPATIEWKPAFGEPVRTSAIGAVTVAARSLIPGRPVVVSDLKSAELIQRGQYISLVYASGAVRVMLPARALDGGVAGDLIQAATLDSPSKVYQGRIQPDGHVQICF